MEGGFIVRRYLESVDERLVPFKPTHEMTPLRRNLTVEDLLLTMFIF